MRKLHARVYRLTYRFLFLADDPIAITPTPTPFSAKALDVAPSKSTEYADFSQRFVASLIDDFICTITSFIMVAVATTVMGSHSDSGVFIVLGLIFSPIIGCIYYASLESSQKQATWGKQLAGIRVTDLYGNRINFGRACVRFCGKFLSWLILFAGHLMMLCSPKRQALHDAVADTLVVQNRASRNANKPNWC
jgi:uncharacterized RDD family membrane protein YckC